MTSEASGCIDTHVVFDSLTLALLLLLLAAYTGVGDVLPVFVAEQTTAVKLQTPAGEERKRRVTHLQEDHQLEINVKKCVNFFF